MTKDSSKLPQAKCPAEALIERLDLAPHPEGGHFRQTYCSSVQVDTPRGSRPASTAIFFLLSGDERSHWHRIASDELWYFHEGAPLEIWEIDEEGRLQTTTLCPDHPQYRVPAGRWFGSRLAEPDGYALVSCGVAPGFVFEDFELAGSIEALGLEPTALLSSDTRRQLEMLLHPEARGPGT